MAESLIANKVVVRFAILKGYVWPGRHEGWYAYGELTSAIGLGRIGQMRIVTRRSIVINDRHTTPFDFNFTL